MNLGSVRLFALVAVFVSGCGTAATPDSPVPAAPPAVVQRDLLTLLPDDAAFPAYLAPDSRPQLLRLDDAAKSSVWNGFGTLIPAGEYEPAGCTPVRTPDMAPYAGSSFAWKANSFGSTSRTSKPSEVVLIGTTIARGEVDEAAVRALTTECGIVRSGGDEYARYTIMPDPKVSSAQVLAIKSEVGLKGGIFRFTYVAEVGEYVVTTYAICTASTTCEKEMSPVFQNAVAKAESA
ncbi:hypothetical protein ACFWN2_10035 [Lentzea sp. NPDC058436]|uniref:hypothetical protein n=1 Tax=Lentzea sp. NPDC058436 TaxID=3346499 RepID=UPI003663A5FB